MSAITRQPEQPVCVHFVNTVSKHVGHRRKEALSSFENFLHWSVAADLLTHAETARLQKWARTHKSEANQFLSTTINFREYLYSLFIKSADAQHISPAKLSLLNDLIAAPVQRTLRAQGGSVSESWSCGDGTQAVLRRIALSAAEVLLSGSWRKIIECARDECDWIAVDTSKNHSRRYCSSAGCGNFARVKRHHERHKREAVSV